MDNAIIANLIEQRRDDGEPFLNPNHTNIESQNYIKNLHVMLDKM